MARKSSSTTGSTRSIASRAKETGAGRKAATSASTTVKKTSVAPPKRRNVKQKTVVIASKSVSSDSIAQRAWEIWQSEGCPGDKALEHWLRAESELLGK